MFKLKNYNFMQNKFNISGDVVCKFADISVLRYEAKGFENLSDKQKLFVYHLSEATLFGRDIIYDQNCRYNLRIRYLLEEVYSNYKEDIEDSEYLGLKEYLYRVWFSNGIHHHYSGDKFIPKFSKKFLFDQVEKYWSIGSLMWLDERELAILVDIIFSKNKYLKRSCKNGENDILLDSSMNMYDPSITVDEVEQYYKQEKIKVVNSPEENISWGLNSRLQRDCNGNLLEVKYSVSSLYSSAIEKICYHLQEAKQYAGSDIQVQVIDVLIKYYKTGDLRLFDEYSCLWVNDKLSVIDFINGFIETYTDPIGLRGAWEGLVHIRDEEASQRSNLICNNAVWFEKNSPVDEQFKKANPIGVTATVVNAVMLGGDSYPATPIGINLPNADWIRKEVGSKSVTIDNIHHAYDVASANNGVYEMFVDDKYILSLIKKYGHITDRLHTDLHECLGHGSGCLAPGVSSDSLGQYGSVIEEARADLFALYYMADDKMIELGLLPDKEAYKSCYYTYLLNGLMLQLYRIELGKEIEEAHMRNRALISRWIIDNIDKEYVSFIDNCLKVSDFDKLRSKFAQLLKEIQRIKSTGDKCAAKELIEKYAIKIDEDLHETVLAKYNQLNISPYKGFVNPKYTVNEKNEVKISYSETYEEQMMRYSREYSTLPLDPVSYESIKNPIELNEELRVIAKQLRDSLRKSMDGVVSQSMREKGYNYGINFGLTRDYILRLANKYTSNELLANYLMSRNVRELKIIGQLLYPSDQVTYTIARYLAEVTKDNIELRDLLAMDLFDRCEYAPLWSYDFILGKFSENSLFPISFITISRHIKRGYRYSNSICEKNLIIKAFEILDDTTMNYITASHRAALLFLKSISMVSNTYNDIIKNKLITFAWAGSSDTIKREFAADLEYIIV